MTHQQFDEERIFHVARSIPDERLRKDYLDQVCDGDHSLRNRVEALLETHENEDGFLASNTASAETADHVPIRENDSQQIGPYKLLQLLGEGGMGTVWLAEQQRPVKRRVAIKLIKQGLNRQEFIARFEAERQALAMMDHPNIAKVLDAGCSNDGRNYFVMEYVKGIPITQFCDDNRLNTEERLKLFIQVCQAVQHAHQKGVIHRDLKPSNVMVAMYDDQPVPKVIDFGVAKATHQPLTEHTLCTVPGQIVGTWEYMSPEQAILNQLDVDTRTDIYSLGVILYELLTGHTPLDLKSLKPEMLEERLRRIREQQPPRPSLRVSSLGQAAKPLATYRNTEASTLSKSLAGDLDMIVMKALEKDRSDRYETANGFAAEIQRFLNDEPLTVRPPSTWRQIKRFYKRHRTFATAGTLVFLTLVIGAALVTWSWRSQVLLVKQLSGEQSTNRELIAQLQTEKENTLAEVDKAKRIADFLVSAIVSASPQYHEGRGEQFTVLDLMYDLENRLSDLDDHLLVKAYCQSALGYAFRTMSEPEKANQHLDQAYRLYLANGGIVSPEARLAMRRVGWHQRNTKILEQLVQIESSQPDVTDLERARTYGHLAVSYYRAGRCEEALEAGVKSENLAPQVVNFNNANALLEMGQLAEASHA